MRIYRLAVDVNQSKRDSLLYSSYGDICSYERDWIVQRQVATNLESYGRTLFRCLSRSALDASFIAGDTIGCGLCGDMSFFTRNGVCLGIAHFLFALSSVRSSQSCNALTGLSPLGLRMVHTVRPVLILTHRSSDFCGVRTNANFGQRPFIFDAASLFSYFHRRRLEKLHEDAASVPQEVFMHFARRILEAEGSTRYTPVMSGMSLVCRAWDDLCRPRRLEVVRLPWMTNFMRACLILGRSERHWHHHSVKTLEVGPHGTPVSSGGRAPSLELVLSSKLARHVRQLEDLAWNALDFGSSSSSLLTAALQPVPPRVHAMLPALLRPLAGLTTLRILNQTFSSFGLFLQVLRALRSATELHLENVRWPSSVGRERGSETTKSALRRIELRRCSIPLDTVYTLIRRVLRGQALRTKALHTTNHLPAMSESVAFAITDTVTLLFSPHFTEHAIVSLDITAHACEQDPGGRFADICGVAGPNSHSLDCRSPPQPHAFR